MQPQCTPTNPKLNPYKPGLFPGNGVEDIHFTAGNPFAVIGGVQVFF